MDFNGILLFAFIVISGCQSKVLKNPEIKCSHTELQCGDGSCVSLSAFCDGAKDCLDGSDEASCNIGTSSDNLSSLLRSQKLVDQVTLCRDDEWRCRGGSCISDELRCNGVADCADGSDESELYCGNNHLQNIVDGVNQTLSRSKRQSACRKNQWRCKNGACISIYGKCDGTSDCPDGSDETFALCRTKTCQSNWFRCTYGACVDGTAPCNKIKDCVDNSDELLPRCRNQTEEVRGTFKCDNGKEISAFAHCDGTRDCTDGSDETVKTCAGKTCASFLFQCAYGACVDSGSDCDNKADCADGSDESDELCNRSLGDNTATVPPVTSTGACKLPPYPEHGSYIVSNVPYAVPGQGFESVGLNITCNPPYGIVGSQERLCLYGSWSPAEVRANECVRFCELKKDPSVIYRCLLTGGSEGTRECNEFEPTGTVVWPECNSPNYYYSGVLGYMRCIQGSWDYVARCTAECGRVVPRGIELVIGGRPAERGELPWHAGIYRKTTTPYMQICGGSLISPKVVISAAHCFWNDTHKELPASIYAVALGKLYRPWGFKQDDDVQRSDVESLKLASHFQGAITNFQHDIALMFLATTIEYRPHIRPVCVDFNIVFEKRQLSPGNMGKVAGWGLDGENGDASRFLKVVELPYISIHECQSEAPASFREYITGDKICAGYRNGTAALCKGDSGGGLAFPESDRGTQRYYLRGIVSTSPNNGNLCNAFWLTTFTQISNHEHFIKEYL